MLASRACRSSIMIGKALDGRIMRRVLDALATLHVSGGWRGGEVGEGGRGVGGQELWGMQGPVWHRIAKAWPCFAGAAMLTWIPFNTPLLTTMLLTS